MSLGASSKYVKRIKPVPAAVQFLDKQLQHADPAIRQAGQESIPTLKVPGEPLTDCLARLLEHQNWYVRQSAADATSQASFVENAVEVAIRDVAGQRLEHTDSYTRVCAGRALVGVATLHADSESPRSTRSTRSTPSVPPAPAAAALALKQRLAHTDPRIVQNAVEALGQMGSAAAPHAPDIGACVASADRGVRNAVVAAFGSLGVAAAGGAESLARSFAHRDGNVRRAASRALVALSQHSGAAAAAGAASQLKHPDRVAREAAASCLADLGPLAAPFAKSLAARLEDGDQAVRLAAVRALVAGGATMAPYVKHVRHRLGSEDADVRRAAVQAMRGLSAVCPVYVRAVGKMLHEDQNDDVDVVRLRVQILDVLGGAGANARPYLDDIVVELEHHDWAVRRAAVEALQDLGEHAAPVAGQVVRRALHHDPNVRRAATEAMGLMGANSNGFGDRIVGLYQTEEDEDVKVVCKRAIEMLKEAGALTQAASQAAAQRS